MPDSKVANPSDLRLLILSPTPPVFCDGRCGNCSPHLNTLSKESVNPVFTTFLTGLTGSAPSDDIESFAGYTSHPVLKIRNKYYNADISLWCDELPSWDHTKPDEDSDLHKWTNQMLSDEAKEVRQVIGGIVLLLPHYQVVSASSEAQRDEICRQIKHVKVVNEVRERIEDESGRDLAAIIAVQDMIPRAAAMKKAEREGDASITSFTEKLENACLSDHGIFGWDIVSWQPELELPVKNEQSASTLSIQKDEPAIQGEKNEYGEKIGMARIFESLEQTNWSARVSNEDEAGQYDLVSTDDLADLADDFAGPGYRPNINPLSGVGKDAISAQSDDFQREIMDLHFALEEQSQQQTGEGSENGDDFQVEQLTGLMDRIVAIREAGAEMTKEEREKFAKREIGKIMRDMSFE